ncbi:flagellar motor protein MotB [Mesorhizobium sp. L-8-10]|uniref:OmpA family protein n=1 Tax=Mesorhizobium sp. L-8-10 TaxID=2744523 RepID=UPI001927E936|nr:OmpA family protein [Mesorhizobium sp. L-8-10]BCH31543.1 flagellar motor protein MotB [Mesorhizobium sp. L-8-10]
MKRQTRILASTAISLLMAGEAFSASLASARQVSTTSGDVILAQAENPSEQRQRRKQQAEEAPEGRAPAEAGASEEQRPRKKQQAEEAPARRAPAQAEAPEEQRPRKKQQAEEAPARRAPAHAEAPDEQRPRKKQQAEQAPARRAPAQAEAPDEQRPRKKQQAEEAPARRAPAQAEAPEEQRPRKKQQAEEAPARRAPAQAEAPEEQRPRKKQRAEEAPARRAPAQAEAPDEQRPRRKEQAEETPARRAPAEAEVPEEQRPRRKEQAKEAPERRAPAEAEGQPEEVRPGRPQRALREQAPEEAPAGEPPVSVGAERPQGEAPVLDSRKRPERPPEDGERAREQPPESPAEAARPGEPEQPQQRERQVRRAPPERQIEPPTDDDAAQADIRRPAEFAPVTEEEGRRIRRRPEDPVRERPRDARVVREMGDRVLLEVDDQIFVESNDRPRIARDAREVYYEELPRGRTREVIVRPDGTRIVTIRDRYGDVIRRSRIAQDDREYVLVYVEDEYYDRVGEWRDPGLDLPPLELTIPVEEYILDAEYVEDPEVYYTFLEQPPVERVERYYSIDEVKRSARIRDKVRRIDLDTITFDFGSASIPESEITRLEGVAQAMERLLQENPAETFLIEGHTDAVGSNLANLALSDRRAEAVAEALTNVFAIPPENLAPQGYGEQYLKVDTQAPERENRRVAIRRITPLVAPVASAQ